MKAKKEQQLPKYEELDKNWFIREISNASNRQGDKLVDLMDRCKKNSLREITREEAIDYYEKFVLFKGENKK